MDRRYLSLCVDPGAPIGGGWIGGNMMEGNCYSGLLYRLESSLEGTKQIFLRHTIVSIWRHVFLSPVFDVVAVIVRSESEDYVQHIDRQQQQQNLAKANFAKASCGGQKNGAILM